MKSVLNLCDTLLLKSSKDSQGSYRHSLLHLRITYAYSLYKKEDCLLRHILLPWNASLRSLFLLSKPLVHWHTVDRAVWVILGSRIDNVVGTDHQHHVCLGEIIVDLIHFEHNVIRYFRFGQQYIHMSRASVQQPDEYQSVLRSLYPEAFC